MENRQKFEALPEVNRALSNNTHSFEDGYYRFKGNVHNTKLVYAMGFVNGAWYAFQEQEKVINMQECGAKQIIEIIKDYESSEKPASFYIKKIKELLK